MNEFLQDQIVAELERVFSLVAAPPIGADVADTPGNWGEVLEVQGDKVILRLEDEQIVRVPLANIKSWVTHD